MSSFIAAILKATVGLLVNKGRNVAAEKLKEGDVTNEQLCNLIVSQLDDIKLKLDGIARKEMLASISFFKEGLVYLYKVKHNEEDGKRTQQREERAATPLKQEVGSSEASIKTVSLVEEMRSLQLTDRDNSSARALNDAKDRFKQAREKATEAFYNEALSILTMQDRIMATILEKVDCFPDALAACRLCLEELHSMPAVRKSLDVHLQQGFKSRFNKAEREDTIHSVSRMNRVIFHIAQIVEEDDISLWPCIDRGEDKIDPLRDVRVTQTIEKEDPQYFLLKTWPFFQEGEGPMKVRDWYSTINPKGELMIAATDDNANCVLLKVFDRNENLLQSLQLKLPAIEFKYYCLRVKDIASDRANNVFTLNEQRRLQVHRNSLWGFVTEIVIVFDHQANFQHEFPLIEGARGFRIAVSDHNKVLVLAEVEARKNKVQVYNFNGVLLYSVEIQGWGRTVDLSSIDPEGDKILVLGRQFDFKFREQGIVPSEYYIVGLVDHTYFLHNTELVASPDICFHVLCLYKKNGELVRKIELKPSPSDYCIIEEAFTMTTQGLVAMVTTDKRTGKKIIAIL
ncbi:uncharacterized protein LOC122963335 [Acropora millepora]|uniref:uncharacterized protein LOC122963335 n=1 Tax=Acropora millepora TaxID=45264 RepID=UPI001CF19F57|nr:uncharacterized protein LOC122963335 [Acropora millepora]